MREHITIGRRFRGPPSSGNGGYTAGALATFLSPAASAAVEVTLRKPPALDRPLDVRRGPDRVELYDAAELVAEARCVELELAAPALPSFSEAIASARAYAGHHRHIYPECFVCGPERAEGDGLRIFAGRLRPDLPVAAPFTPDRSLGPSGAPLAPCYIWAALDCPGYFALDAAIPAVLGRITTIVDGDVRVGERYVVVGWQLGRDGRKYQAATALLSADGRVLARSKQVWISL